MVNLPLHVGLRFAGRYRDTLSSRKDPFNGELSCSESECDSSSRRVSFMKMVGLGKMKRESTGDRVSVGTEEPLVQEVVEEVKPREPLSGERTSERRRAVFVVGHLQREMLV